VGALVGKGVGTRVGGGVNIGVNVVEDAEGCVVLTGALGLGA